jgi:hypothetical protein
LAEQVVAAVAAEAVSVAAASAVEVSEAVPDKVRAVAAVWAEVEVVLEADKGSVVVDLEADKGSVVVDLAAPDEVADK